MPKFAILMREDDDAWSRLPQAEQDRILPLYHAWVKDLRERGAFVDGEPLGRGGRVLRAAAGEVVESLYDETAQVETGFFIVEAADLDAATALARTCPALGHGETVVVRPVGHV